MTLLRLAAGVMIALLPLSGTAAAETAAEPETYRTEQYRAPVPATLEGARVIDTEAAEKLKEAGAVFIDVFPQAPKPPNLPKNTVWRAPKHSTIAGAHWLPNVGYGVLNADFESYFRKGLEKLTGGDKAKPIVLFCLRDCWMSWNAAKRALEWGYSDVIWYPDGVDGWKEWALPTEDATAMELDGGS